MLTNNKNATYCHSGFSLIELLVVISILTTIAAATFISVVEQVDQTKYDETKERYDKVRESIFGDEELLILNGAPQLKGFLNDTGSLPNRLAELSQNTIAQYKTWSVIGSEIEDLNDDTFTTNVLPHISIKDGWNGPYHQRDVDAGVEPVDGWGNNFVYDISNSNFLELFSKGREGQRDDDPNTVVNVDDEIGYERDYPEAEKRQIFRREYEVSPVEMPKAIQITIENSRITQPENFFIGLIYPGLDLNEDIFPDGTYHDSLEITGNSILTGVAGTVTTLADLQSEPDPNRTDHTLFTLKRLDNEPLYFPHPLARRYQICIYRVANAATPNGALYTNMLAVHPQQFYFLPGTNADPRLIVDNPWIAAETGRQD